MRNYELTTDSGLSITHISYSSLQFAYRETHQQEEATQIVRHHRRATDHLLPWIGQPHCHGTL